MVGNELNCNCHLLEILTWLFVYVVYLGTVCHTITQMESSLWWEFTLLDATVAGAAGRCNPSTWLCWSELGCCWVAWLALTMCSPHALETWRNIQTIFLLFLDKNSNPGLLTPCGSFCIWHTFIGTLIKKTNNPGTLILNLLLITFIHRHQYTTNVN